MKKAVISGDIVAYTSLRTKDKDLIDSALKNLIKELEARFDAFSRIIKGDYIECYVPDPKNALRAALCIKSYIKSISQDIKDKNRRLNAFKTHGIRLAIGIGEINRFDKEKGIIDGEAIYFSGRIINKSRTTSDKKRIVIKKTLFIQSNNQDFDQTVEVILGLLDVFISKATAKQCSVLYLKLIGNTEDEITEKLKLKSQSTVNKHSTSIGWNAIEDAVLWFEKQLMENNK
ncbi:MAG: RNA polymerase subunit sigma-70 [Bacteroidales bacterium]|jgi:hypothetical protein|nr:RNA polymerase subunit sigma-70 [Bacteroidales bacterium]